MRVDAAVGEIVSLRNRASVRVTHRVVTADPFGSNIPWTLEYITNALSDAELNRNVVDLCVGPSQSDLQ